MCPQKKCSSLQWESLRIDQGSAREDLFSFALYWFRWSCNRGRTAKRGPIRCCEPNLGSFHQQLQTTLLSRRKYHNRWAAAGIRGRCGFRMYVPNKPAKYGMKIMVICDSKSSYMLNGMPYLVKKTKPPGAVALGHYVTMELCKPYFSSKRNITGDNWFTSVPLVNKLLEKGLTYVGTIRKNKCEIPEEMTNKNRFKPR